MVDRLNGVTIAFDLDGTLVDTAPDLIGAVGHVLAALGREPVGADLVRADISRGAKEMLRTAVLATGPEIAEIELERLYRDVYLPRYEATIADLSRPFPGVVAALDRLAERGARLVVVTNKWEGLSRKLLGALGLSPRFGAIAGRDTFPVYKPHPDHLTGAVRAAGGDPRRALMIGDSDTDVATARAAAVPVVGVTFGYTSVPMHALAADATIDHFDELLPALDRLMARPDRWR